MNNMSVMLSISGSSSVEEALGVGKINAVTLLKLLDAAGSEVERDKERAQSLIVRASALLQAEIDRSLVERSNDIATGGLPAWQIRRIRLYIEEHLDEPLHLEVLSAIVKLSVTHFSRSFKRSLGETPHSYVTGRRLEHARHLMLTTNDSLSDIALACGFADQAHFSRSFRQGVKQSPAAWRRQSGLAA
jgi:AraC family transcriptional regulator